MAKNVEFKCTCGQVTQLDLSEEMNRKDAVYSDCGRDFIIVETTEKD